MLSESKLVPYLYIMAYIIISSTRFGLLPQVQTTQTPLHPQESSSSIA
jgi:hypothetical protein